MLAGRTMESGRLRGKVGCMNRPQPFNRYMLVPRTAAAGTRVKRYSLARVGDSRRSALGEDRHERLERAAAVHGSGTTPDPSGDFRLRST